MIGWWPSLSHYHLSRHFLCCSLGEPVSVYSTIDSLYCYPAHSSIPERHFHSWPYLLYSVSFCSLCILWCWLGKRSHWSKVYTGYCFLLGSSLILGKARNKPLWPALALKWNIVPLLIPHSNSSGFNGFLKISVCLHPLLLLFIIITRMPFKFLTMMSSMNKLNTSRLIVILSAIILSMVLSSCSQSLLKINLQIFSPSHILRDAFMLWLTTSTWSHTCLEFKVGC